VVNWSRSFDKRQANGPLQREKKPVCRSIRNAKIPSRARALGTKVYAKYIVETSWKGECSF
jgi:hypothetical protein